MNIYKIYADMLEKPNAQKFYKDLKEHYEKAGMINESKAFEMLIEEKFNHDKKPDNTHSDKE